MAALAWKPDVPRADFGSPRNNVRFSRKQSFTRSDIERNDRQLTAYSVEKLRFRRAGKFVMNFIAPAAQITVAFLASEALLGGFS